MIYWEQADLLLIAVGAIATLCLPKRRRVLLLLLLTLAIAFAAKEYYADPRPCAENALLCLSSYGFPSIHAAGATLIALASVGCLWFYVFAPAAAIIAASRVFFGLHSFLQVAAGIALGAAVWIAANEILDALEERKKKKRIAEKMENVKKAKHAAHAAVPRGFGEKFWFEAKRQGAHMLFGACVIAIALALGKDVALAALIASLAVGIVIMQFARRGIRFFFTDWALEVFERRDAKPGWGALNFVVGALFALSFSHSLAFGCAAIAFLAFGDGFSTIIGLGFGRTPAHGSKSWEGFAGFAGAAFVTTFALIGWQSALFYAVVLGLVEIVDFKVNDNLLVPIVAVVLRQATGI
ncbi:MAG: phosphatase PAP2 family protein [Candidatus Micrarchaeota archaeon]